MATIIVGAGFAGISTAYHLARRGVREILVLEREQGPGTYASGRNAGLLRQSSHDEALAPLLRSGSRAARRILSRIPGALTRSGSLILGPRVKRLRAGLRAGIRDAGDIVAGLAGPALFDPEDAIADPHALLGAYLAGARRRGVVLSCCEELTGIRVEAGRVAAAETSRRTLVADRIIVAAGAWSAGVAGLAGSREITLENRRRHLFRGQLDRPDAHRMPFVWHDGDGVYFRPEGDGMLLSPCDAVTHPARPPEVDLLQKEALAEKLAGTFGALGEWRVGPGWACLRTFAPDERFLIGPDPTIGGLFWVAGLGGHGMTASWAVGRLAAECFLGRADPGSLDPRRFGSRG